MTDPHATGNMLAWGLSVEDVCDAICDWIDNGGRVKPTVVKKHPEALAGMVAYELARVPILSRHYYVRLAVYQRGASVHTLLLISLHSS